jgi:hypothetical protein
VVLIVESLEQTKAGLRFEARKTEGPAPSRAPPLPVKGVREQIRWQQPVQGFDGRKL